MLDRTKLVKRFKRNTKGRDIGIGDIHGCYDRVERALEDIGFDPAVDRLFGTGDLVDRGPQSSQARRWLEFPWFETVAGNHDDYVVRWPKRPEEKWVSEGGQWFQNYSVDTKNEWARDFAELPVAIEVETEHGLVGIVHADCIFDSWFEFTDHLENQPSERLLWLIKNSAQGSRYRFVEGDTRIVQDVRAVIVGHCKTPQVKIVGNVHHIDTEGWKKGHFTLYNLATLRPEPCVRLNSTSDSDATTQ